MDKVGNSYQEISTAQNQKIPMKIQVNLHEGSKKISLRSLTTLENSTNVPLVILPSSGQQIVLRAGERACLPLEISRECSFKVVLETVTSENSVEISQLLSEMEKSALKNSKKLENSGEDSHKEISTKNILVKEKIFCKEKNFNFTKKS